MKRGKASSTGHEGLDALEDEVREVEEHALPSAPFVYQVVRREGARELRRPTASLWWSGFSAGVAIGLSLLLKAVLHNHLPETAWRPLVENLGYTSGFVIVILSRYQLFTENTVTAILPLMLRRSFGCLRAVAHLWLTVAAANLAGTAVFAAFWTFSGAGEPELAETMREFGRRVMENDVWRMFIKAVAAGYLMASLVWVMAGAQEAKFWCIIFVSYIIAVLDLTHIVVGGVEILMLVWAGETSVFDFLLRFGVPVFIGNVIGGTGMFSVVVYAQVRREMRGRQGADQGNRQG